MNHNKADSVCPAPTPERPAQEERSRAEPSAVTVDLARSRKMMVAWYLGSNDDDKDEDADKADDKEADKSEDEDEDEEVYCTRPLAKDEDAEVST